MDRQTHDSRTITFCCANCGSKLAVRRTHAGKRGRCPKCRQMLTVPTGQAENTSEATAGDPAATVGKSPLHDPRLLDIAPADTSPGASSAESNDAGLAYLQLQMLQGGRLPGQDDEVPSRKLPWIIDIFLYPLSRAGLSILLISVGIPFILRVIVRFFFFFMGSFGPALVFWVLFIMLHWGGLAMLVLYMNWYVCECIRDSAAGAIRAADTAATTPGLGEILGQALKGLVSAAVCMAPAMIYWSRTQSTDGLFKVLYGAGAFLFPMALLAVVMHDALHGLNPVLLIRSILRVPFQYCALAPFCCALCLLVPVAGHYLVTFWILGYALLFLAFYQLLILAHLLGRFYWRNEERLNWDA